MSINVNFHYICPTCKHDNKRFAPYIGDGVIVSTSVFWCNKCNRRIALSYRFRNNNTIEVIGEVPSPQPWHGPYHRDIKGN